MSMTTEQGQRLIDALLDSWDRNNTILLNLLRVIPADCLDARAMEGSGWCPSWKNCAEYGGAVPAHEWSPERDANRIAQMLHESARRVRDAVKSRIERDLSMDCDFAHPLQLVQLLIFHEGYHHGQIKLALKAAGRPISDDDAGPLTWDVWRAR